MFFKNKKTDSKIRFQQTSFRRQLQSARGYKRQAQTSARPSYFWLKLFGGAALILILYLVYLPSFLSIKHIQVSGVDAGGRQQIINLTQKYLKLKPFTAQDNWWLLSPKKLSAYLLQQDDQITRVDFIKKQFPNTLNIGATARTTAYNVTLPLQRVLVSNDGVVEQDVTALGTSTTPQMAGLIPVTVDTASTTGPGQKFLPDGMLTALEQLNNLTVSQLRLTLDHFELPDLTSGDVIEYFTADFKIMFNDSLNMAQSINQAQLILNNLPPGQQKNLYYIDMRFAGKGYVCYKNTPCVQDLPVQNIATTTDQTAPN